MGTLSSFPLSRSLLFKGLVGFLLLGLMRVGGRNLWIYEWMNMVVGLINTHVYGFNQYMFLWVCSDL